MRRLWLLCATLLPLLACREGPEPFSAEEPRFGGPPWRLTFSLGDDRAPSWSPDGDSVYYTAEGFDHLPPSPGVLVAVPREGGVARPILGDAQIPRDNLSPLRWLVSAMVAPTGDRLAYTEIEPLWNIQDLCGAPDAAFTCDPSGASAALPPLRQVVLRVRALDSTDPIEADLPLKVPMAGVREGPSQGPSGVIAVFIVEFHPYQRLFEQERSLAFRATWAPGGDRLVYSNGLQLLIWRVGAARGDPIPNTADGVSPAWSPDGERIAFSRIERAGSSGAVCTFFAGLGGCIEERTEYVLGRRILSLVRPDGSGLIELGEGDEPAWAPDGETLFFRRDDRIWRSAADGSNAAPVPGTEAGREPAPSPDGRLLAFARRSAKGDHDVWVIPISPTP